MKKNKIRTTDKIEISLDSTFHIKQIQTREFCKGGISSQHLRVHHSPLIFIPAH